MEDQIILFVRIHFDIELSEMMEDSGRKASNVRKFCYLFLRKYASLTDDEIAKLFKKSRSTVSIHIKNLEGEIAIVPEQQKHYNMMDKYIEENIYPKETVFLTLERREDNFLSKGELSYSIVIGNRKRIIHRLREDIKKHEARIEELQAERDKYNWIKKYCFAWATSCTKLPLQLLITEVNWKKKKAYVHEITGDQKGWIAFSKLYKTKQEADKF